MISFIVAMDKYGVIGKNNQIPWHIPEDLKRFKRITMGHKIVMGRKTFESIGRALPGRENIILTRNENFNCSDCTVFTNQQSLIDFCLQQNEEIFIIGGADLFNLFLPYVEKLYITKIDEQFDGDVFFPSIDWNNFKEISREEGSKNEKNPYQYNYITYKKV